MPHGEKRDDVGVADAGEEARLLPHRALPFDRELPGEPLDAHLPGEAEERLRRARPVDAAGSPPADAGDELEALAGEAGDEPRRMAKHGSSEALSSSHLSHRLASPESCVLSAREGVDYGRDASAPSPRREPVRDLPPVTLVTRDVGARGARVRFYEGGEGPPLVLVHGYLWSGTVWEDVFPLLARSFRVIVPDLPGFGESEKPPPARYPYSLEAFAESLVDLVAALGVGRVSVCGHSMGGAVALMLAARQPDLVEKLIVVDPIVYGSRRGPAASIATLPVLGPILFKQVYGRAMFRRYFRENVYATDESVPGDRIERMFATFNVPAAREAAYATMLATLDTRPLVASVPRVNAPTLVAWGRSDRTVPVEHGRRLARELRRARFEVFDCGHSPAEEVPGPFAEVVSGFLLGKALP